MLACNVEACASTLQVNMRDMFLETVLTRTNTVLHDNNETHFTIYIVHDTTDFIDHQNDNNVEFISRYRNVG